MMTTELKPCPFCGGQPKVERGPTNPRDLDYMLTVRCQKCGEKVQRMTGGWTEKEETTLNELAAEWNSKQAHELKPCPFCGRSPQLQHDYSGCGCSYIQCVCGMTSPRFMKSFARSSDKDAIEAWNRRAKDGN